MRPFECQCGTRVFFDNVQCLTCSRELGFVPGSLALAALTPGANGTYTTHISGSTLFRKCRNYAEQAVCTWMVRADDPNQLCRACRLNRVVPNLSLLENRIRWAKIEAAKRHLVYTLDQLGLAFSDKSTDPEHGLAFEFKADTAGDKVMTGHHDGIITLKVEEADPVLREKVRAAMREPYRSLLGHLRHEVGHYFFDLFFDKDESRLEPFRALFGDERQSYAQALERHYVAGAAHDWSGNFISAYAQAHPWEDWAETFAHYLHMVDTLETAETFGAIAPEPRTRPLVERWLELTVVLNALNRSMGLDDAYPFTVGDGARRKVEFVQEVVSRAAQSAADLRPPLRPVRQARG